MYTLQMQADDGTPVPDFHSDERSSLDDHVVSMLHLLRTAFVHDDEMVTVARLDVATGRLEWFAPGGIPERVRIAGRRYRHAPAEAAASRAG